MKPFPSSFIAEIGAHDEPANLEAKPEICAVLPLVLVTLFAVALIIASFHHFC